MRFLRTLLFPHLVALTSFALARSSTGVSVFVLLDSSHKENFSIFFGDLERCGAASRPERG